MFRLFLIGLLSLLLFSTNAVAGPRPASLDEDERILVEQARRYLQSVTSLKGRFVQVNSQGSYAEGKVFISRPGRLRLEYDPPMPVLIVANGTWLAYYDKELRQSSHLLLSSTPANFLVRETIQFSGDVTLTKFNQGPNVVALTMVDTEEPEKGSITLIFSRNPMMLRQWSVLDAQGETTTVTLMDPRYGMELKDELFELNEPWEREQRFD